MQDNIIIFPEQSPDEESHLSKYRLPTPLTPLVGRQQDITVAQNMLRRPDVHVLTFVGTGGVGKTRLGLEIASQMQAFFEDGVCFVSLAPISDPNLVPFTIAQQLKLKEEGDQPILNILTAFLQDKHMLLLLDNIEQVVAVVPMLAHLLTSCPRLKLLATSRVVLHMSGEHIFPVSPLALPDLKQTSNLQALSQYAAITLFLQRIQAIKPDFLLTTTNAQSIAEICVKLDGLPLAIELAAARIRLLPPHALLARLTQRLSVLTKGDVTSPTRQQTLRNTLQWSYDLLAAHEQQLFRYLSIFVGDFTLEAAEHVCGTLHHDTPASSLLDGIESLLENSLLQQREGEEDVPRLFMLETIREYGLECLTESGEMERTRQEHATYYQAVAHEAGLHLHNVGAGRWLDQLEQVHDNLRSVLNWLLECGEVTHALRLCNDLFWYWLLCGHLSEGRTFLERGVLARGETIVSVRARSWQALGMLTVNQGDTGRAEEYWQRSLVLFEEVGDRRGTAWTLLSLAIPAETRGEYTTARRFLEASLRLFRELGTEHSGGPTPAGGSYPMSGATHALYHLAMVARDQGEYDKAKLLAEESLAVLKTVGDNDGIIETQLVLASVAFNKGEYVRTQKLLAECFMQAKEDGDRAEIIQVLTRQGELAFIQGEVSEARVLLEESVTLGNEIEDVVVVAETLCALGRVETHAGDYAKAHTLYKESLIIARRTHYNLLVASCLEGLAEVASAQHEQAWATRLWGTAEFLRETMGTPLPPVWRPGYECAVANTRALLTEQNFARLLAEGRSMTLDDVLASREPILLSLPVPVSPPPVSHPKLTSRELDVLRLLAQGLTSAQIAERLVISLVTVNSHIRSIYNKLDVTSRSAATRYAIEHHLV